MPTWPTFELDLAASSIGVETLGCAYSCAGLTGDFGAGAEAFSWTPTSATDQLVVDDFFDWSVDSAIRTGAEVFNVHTELVFSSPDLQSTSANGRGLVVNLWGDYAAGILRWTDAASVTFDQGSSLDIAFQGIAGLWSGTVSTAATFIGNLVQPNTGTGGPTSSVPLPGSLLLLISAFGAFFGVNRLTDRRKALGATTA